MNPELESLVTRITPKEWRVIALSIEGVSGAAASEALGIAPGTLESHKQAIRRKLGIPRGERFEHFVRANFAQGVQVPSERDEPNETPRAGDASDDVADRRVRWLLRITLQEIQELSASAGLRAQLLSQTVRRLGHDPGDAEKEVRELTQISSDLTALFDDAIARIRSRAAESDQPSS